MAINNKALSEFIQQLDLEALNIEDKTSASVKELIADAISNLTNLLAEPSITAEDKGLALLHFTQRLIPYATGQAIAANLYVQLIATLLEQPNIQLVYSTAAQATHSILYELVESTRNNYKPAQELLTTYLTKVPNPEAVILQEITPPIASLPPTDAIKACIAENNTEALLLLLPYIVTPEHKAALWQRLVASRKEAIIEAILSSNLLSLDDKNACLLKEAQDGNTAIVQLLLDNGADINQADRYGHTVLMKAAEKGHFATIKLLIDRGADINRADCFHNTVLMSAAMGGNLAVVQLLLDRDVNIHHTNGDGYTALFYAAGNGHLAVVELLLAKGVSSTQVDCIAAIESNNLALVKLLLKDGYINSTGHNGCTALTKAVFKDNIAIVNLLLGRGADINQADRDGDVALCIATYRKNIAMVQLLLDRGANINQINRFRRTALMEAARPGYKTIVELLLDRGADVNIMDPYGKTALDVAAPSCLALLQHRENNRVRPR